MTVDCALDGYVGLFFIANDTLLLHKQTLAEAEPYGDFINYTESHNDVWQRKYARKYKVDFDYFPRGRIVYNQKSEIFLLYYDKCVASEAKKLCECYTKDRCIIVLDEHYQCHKCNINYIV